MDLKTNGGFYHIIYSIKCVVLVVRWSVNCMVQTKSAYYIYIYIHTHKCVCMRICVYMYINIRVEQILDARSAK